VFDAPTPRELIRELRPDALVKGGDWGPDEIVGREEVEAAGGRVVSVPLEPGYSTTGILEKILNSARPPARRSSRSRSPQRQP
jgi:D-glycero-beta-D-manno-heptose 1-phosphate adenylyltransferase